MKIYWAVKTTVVCRGVKTNNLRTLAVCSQCIIPFSSGLTPNVSFGAVRRPLVARVTRESDIRVPARVTSVRCCIDQVGVSI